MLNASPRLRRAGLVAAVLAAAVALGTTVPSLLFAGRGRRRARRGPGG